MYKNNRLQSIALTFTGFFLLYMTVGYSLPVSWYVDIERYEALDACVGTSAITYSSDRTPAWGIKGETYSQIVRFDGIKKTETTIHRGSVSDPVSFGYEPDTYGVQYDTTWFKVNDQIYTWPEVGEYGANEWITIYPLPLIERNWFNSAEDARFNIIQCDS